MLSLKPISHSKDAKTYFFQPDYYNGQDSLSSFWYGKGAEKLNLKGQVQQEAFTQLLDGHLPDGTRLGRRGKDGKIERTCGLDLTFSAPKSVSILALTGGDERLIDAHHEAVQRTLKYAENLLAATRVRKNGQLEWIKTENLVVAGFTHTTSRAGDPGVHTHSVLQNLTQKPDGTWRSLDLKPFFDLKMHLGLVYRSFLSRDAVQHGYEIEKDEKQGTFEIKGVPRDVILEHSTRSRDINALADTFGITTAKGKEKANLYSRQAKKAQNEAELLARWDETNKQLGFDPKALIEASKEREPKDDISDAKLYQGVQESIRILAEKEAVFSGSALKDLSLKQLLGEATVDDVSAGVRKHLESERLLAGGVNSTSSEWRYVDSYTTQAALSREKAIIRSMKRGQGTVRPILSKTRARKLIDKHQEKAERKLNAGQRAAAEFILSSKDRFIGIQGYAGTGKTTMLRRVNEVASEAGYVLLQGKAVTAKAASELEESSGIASITLSKHLYKEHKERAESKTRAIGKVLPIVSTVERFLKDFSGKLPMAMKEVWVIDESSMVGADDQIKLMKAAENKGARIIFTGDSKQIVSITWGRTFAQLMDNGMNTAQLSEVVRQKKDSDLAKAVNALVKKRSLSESFNWLDKHMVEHDSEHDRVSVFIEEYLKLSPEKRLETLALIPDNQTRKHVSESVRSALQQRNEMSSDDRSFERIERCVLLSHEKSRVETYSEGMFVTFLKDYKSIGVNKHEILTVKGIDKDRQEVLLQKKNGTFVVWNPAKVAGKSRRGVEVEQKVNKPLAIGERICWKKNNKELDIKNSDLGTVASIAKEYVTIKFDNGKTHTLNMKEENNKYWDYGYVSTVFSAQGATYKNALIMMESFRRNLVNMKSFYVAITRAEEQVKVITNNKADLLVALSQRSGEKTSAIEVVEKNIAKTNAQKQPQLVQPM